jgi:FkbM family methyltransferase
MNYAKMCVSIAYEIDGVKDWVWPSNDREGFQGVTQDWIKSHKEKYLKYVDNWNVCVQAGGFTGIYPRLLSDMFTRVYTFEPDPLNFYCLTHNCQKDNIIKQQMALGHEHKLITVNRPREDNVGMNTINENYQIIPMITLDSLNLDDLGFLQLDVEYYELNVLRGAIETIKKFKPVITCELGWLSYFDHVKQDGLKHNAKIMTGNTLEADILDLLGPIGYKKVDTTVSDAIYKII